ncbi:MAG: SusC/RagA family TonB-linked outer membrane protein [Odoribacter sp.]|nr:SusC/RagA family TonB-linked outer membrane protein [Odoribacter sp.]
MKTKLPDGFRGAIDIRKTFLVMKLYLVFTLFLTLTVSASVYSQNERISFTLETCSLGDALIHVKDMTGAQIIYNEDLLEHLTCRKLTLDRVTVAEAIEEILKGSGFYCEKVDEVFVIKPLPQQQQIAQPARLSGKVTDEQGQPLPGVTVAIKGIAVGSVTDVDGKYMLHLPDSKKCTLVFSFIGMRTQEVAYTGQKEINITMNEESTQMDEVVITGYQNIDKRKLTSAVTTIKVDDIRVPGINTIDQMLEGRIPGMIFMQNSGQVGAAPKLRIRGTSTVLGNREPLWVLDGVVLTDPVNVDPAQLNDLDFVNLLGNAISGLNPDDIEQIDVLKDASATALYGAKAGNGVIVITTRKGKVGAPSVTYSVTGTYTRRPRYSDRAINLMNSKERVDVSRELVERGVFYNNIDSWVGYEAAIQDYYNGAINYGEFNRLVGYYETLNTDWFDVVCQDVFSHNHTLSLSGGSNNIRYYASLGMNDDKGAIKGEKNKRYSTTLNLTANYRRFTARFQLQGSMSERDYNPSELGVLDYAYGMNRAVPAFNPDGSRYLYQRVVSATHPVYNFNVLNEMDNSGDEMKGSSLNMQANVGYNILNDLKLEGTLSYAINNTNQEVYFTESSYYVHKLRQGQAANNDLCPIGGELRESNIRNTNWMARLQANYLKSLGDAGKHNVNASAGVEVNSQRYDGFSITRRGYYRDRGKLFASVPTTNSAYYNQFMSSPDALGRITENLTNSVAWYAMAGYDYDNRYMLNLHVRGEASNLFGSRANDRMMPIWALSARWNVKRDILESVGWIEDMALRGSFGYQGNMLSNQTPYMIIQQGTDYMGKYGELTSTVAHYPNPDLRWEKTASTNVTLDFSFLNNKINGSVSYYYKKTRDAFLTKTISEINGVNQYVVNSGTLVNKGIEVSLNFTPINRIGLDGGKRGFVWRIDPQLGQVLNELVNSAINNRNHVLRDEITYNDMLTGNVEIAGEPLNTFYSYRFKGLSPEDGSPMFYGAEDELQEELAAKYKNMEKEDVFLAVMERSGRREPYLQGGVSNYFGYRNFGLSFNLTYSLGNKIRLLKLCTNYGTTNPRPNDNLRREFVNRWRKPGDENYTNIPGLNTIDNPHGNPWWSQGATMVTPQFASNVYDMYDNSDIRVVSGNYLRLSSLSFRYNVDDRFCKKLGIKSAYINLTGTNLFTIANKKLKGQDPAQSGSAPSVNLSIRPTYSCNLSITF